MSRIKFGWAAPVIGVPESEFVPIVMAQQAQILPVVAEHFDSVWVFDHFYGFDRRTDPYLECWTTLTWLAARFPRLQVGTLVMGVGYRNPALLAKMSATLQALSHGRLVLGIGAGWRGEEYAAYGYPFPKAAVRIQQLEEAVQIIRRMWREAAPSFTGKHYEIKKAYCPPQPSPPPPLMIGGQGEQLMLPLIARWADWWNAGFMDAETYRRKRDILHRHAEAAGRDPAQIVHTFMKEGLPLPATSRDSARWLDELRPLAELGVTHFMLDFGHVTSREPVLRFVEEVMAPLNAE
ncbi:MAG: TIGR03560 family F420-dependent LLM class oxidoreductase [Anaerolineales bacterium]|nr:MAG: TIGR03560 family F420-dependent LLM class oxidoreductase [Anaerolineales bacterium]